MKLFTKPPKRANLTVRLPLDMLKQVAVLAKSEKVSKGRVIESALALFFAKVKDEKAQ